jgi:tRNA pseudouridine13 synthase
MLAAFEWHCLGRPMKLKCRPEDFRVEELPLVSPEKRGRYMFYRLSKRSLGTIEAIESICRRWKVAGRRVSYAGLKDRHAATTQYLTIADGPASSASTPNLELEPVGRLSHPYGPQHFRGNRFGVVIRDLSEADLCRAASEIGALPRSGLPNYFDDQRFGSVGASGQFIGHAWLLGDHERALWLALADANPFDRSAAKAQKATLRATWGRWTEAKARLGRSSTRSIVTYLIDHPTDYRGAFARMARALRTLYFSAFQSHLWNLFLAGWLERSTRPEQRLPIELKEGTFPFPRALEPDQIKPLAESSIALPSSRNAAPTGEIGEVIFGVLERFQLAWSGLRVKHLRDVFFSKGARACLFFPENLECRAIDDELHPGRRGLRLSFELAKGSYATIVVKRITAAMDSPQ